VLQETDGHLYRSSRLSRLAEQLGWAIRQTDPEAVDADCLRNAVNKFFYQSPDDLPTSAPASQISSEPHSLSRVFTGAFFEALALMFATSSSQNEATLEAVSLDIATILLGAIRHSPVVPEYFAQVGAHMVSLALAKSPAYGDAVKTAMVKHGILSVPGAVAAAASPAAAQLDGAVGVVDSAPAAMPLTEVDVSGYGLTVKKVSMVTASEPKRFGIAGAAPSTGDASSHDGGTAATRFFEDLIRRGRLDHGGFSDARTGVAASRGLKTHKLVKENNEVVLRRIRIDCGLNGRSTRKP
jgi:hypothetical protein